jgi:hypothetical protein
VSWAWALGSPPFCGGHATGGGVPVAPVGAGLGVGEREAEELGDGRAMLGLGLDAAVGGTDVGAGDGPTTGVHASTAAIARGVMRERMEPRTFVV